MISIILPMCFGAKSLLKSSRSACSFGSADYTFFGINITSYFILSLNLSLSSVLGIVRLTSHSEKQGNPLRVFIIRLL